MTPIFENLNTWFLIFTPIFLYAEIHYRIAGIFSRYFKREPEILADVPHRLSPQKQMPVFLCIKDAHRFPIVLFRVHVFAFFVNEKQLLLEKNFQSMPIYDSMWTELLYCDLPKNTSAPVKIDVIFEYSVRDKIKTCVNDNYALTSHAPFDVVVDSQPRPRADNWYFGDMHTHSHLTGDQVEFGAPFEITSAMARAMGLDFFASADHSYDLDDRPDDYLVNDPKLPKWNLLWERVQRLNDKNKDFVVIPGEELSVGNSMNQNVHLLIFNNRHFFEGSGDGAEQWLFTKPQHRIKEVLPQLEDGALAFASHPEIKPPKLQQLLLRRGAWRRDDYFQSGLNGVQMWNGDKEHFINHGLSKWIDLLLMGRKLTLIAGTDAHGSFNRFRQIGMPHFTMREEKREIFGSAVTGVYVENEYNLETLLQALKMGRAIVTDGPFVTFQFLNANGTARIGDRVHQTQGRLLIEAESTASFGEIVELLMIVGDVRSKKETQRLVKTPLGSFSFKKEIELEALPRPGYVRVALKTGSDHVFHCFANPIYID